MAGDIIKKQKVSKITVSNSFVSLSSSISDIITIDNLSYSSAPNSPLFASTLPSVTLNLFFLKNYIDYNSTGSTTSTSSLGQEGNFIANNLLFMVTFINLIVTYEEFKRLLILNIIFENFFVPAIIRPPQYGVVSGLAIDQRSRNNLIQVYTPEIPPTNGKL